MEIEGIAKVIASLTPDCSGDFHEWETLEYYMKERYRMRAKFFVQVANVLIKKGTLAFEKEKTLNTQTQHIKK